MEQIKRLVLPLLHCTPTTSFMGPGAKDGMELSIEKNVEVEWQCQFLLVFFFVFLNRFDDNSSNDQKNPVGLYWVNIIYIAQIREVFGGKCLHIYLKLSFGLNLSELSPILRRVQIGPAYSRIRFLANHRLEQGENTVQSRARRKREKVPLSVLIYRAAAVSSRPPSFLHFCPPPSPLSADATGYCSLKSLHRRLHRLQGHLSVHLWCRGRGGGLYLAQGHLPPVAEFRMKHVCNMLYLHVTVVHANVLHYQPIMRA